MKFELLARVIAVVPEGNLHHITMSLLQTSTDVDAVIEQLVTYTVLNTLAAFISHSSTHLTPSYAAQRFRLYHGIFISLLLAIAISIRDGVDWRLAIFTLLLHTWAIDKSQDITHPSIFSVLLNKCESLDTHQILYVLIVQSYNCASSHEESCNSHPVLLKLHP